MRISLPEKGIEIPAEVLPAWAEHGVSFLWDPAGDSGLLCWQHVVMLFGASRAKPLSISSSYFLLPEQYLADVHHSPFGDAASWIKIGCWFLHILYAETKKQGYTALKHPAGGEISHTFSIDGIPFGILDLMAQTEKDEELPFDVLMKSLIAHHMVLSDRDVEKAMREGKGFQELLLPIFRGSRVQMTVYE